MNKSEFQILNKWFDEAIASPDPMAVARSKSDENKELASALAVMIQNAAGGTKTFLKSLPNSLKGEALAGIGELTKGMTYAGFQIKSLLGEGSFGSVYEAYEVALQRDVAIKISPALGDEAKTMAQLEHTSIVPVYHEQVDPAGHLRCICMPLIQGNNLQNIIAHLEHESLTQKPTGNSIIQTIKESVNKHPSFEPRSAKFRELLQKSNYTEAVCYIFEQLAEGLAFAHERDVVHLDLKPSNILLDFYGKPKIVDFNVSAKIDGSQNVQITGGTPMYASPEQQQILIDDHRKGSTELSVEACKKSDVYSLSLMFLQFISLKKQAPELENLNHLLSQIKFRQLEDLIRDGLAHAPDKRPSSEEFVSRLKSIIRFIGVQNQFPKPIPGTPKYTFLLTLGAAMIPQMLGSLINITYNQNQIVAHLSSLQQQAFNEMLLLYNAIVYPLVFFPTAYLFMRLKRSMESNQLSTLNKKVILNLPKLFFFFASLGWLPGFIAFPAYIEWKTGDLQFSYHMHFFISFVSSWLVASTYSTIGLTALLLRVYYPKLWSPDYPLSSLIGKLNIEKGVSWLLFAAGLIPLCGASMLLVTTVSFESIHMKSVIFSLIVSGMIGFFVAFHAVNYIRSCLWAYNSEQTF